MKVDKKANWLKWQNVPESGKTVQGRIELCSWCEMEMQKGVTISVTSADTWQYCARCGRYGRPDDDGFHTVEVIARVISVDPCDCGTKIAHNNGGNYHYSRLEVIEVLKVL